ncbi:MAG: GAF domain-containing protein [Anaerolineae bacterium]|nr:GAF domain-containing protein [Anaerolineae bacterium]
MSPSSTSPENIFSSTSVRLRVGLLMAASVVLLFIVVASVTIYLSEIVTQDNLRVQHLDHLQRELAQPDARLVASTTIATTLRTLMDGGVVVSAQGTVEQLRGMDDATLREMLEKSLAAWQEFVDAYPNAQTYPDAHQRALTARWTMHTTIAEAQRYVAARQADGVGMVRGMYAALFLSSLVFLLLGLWLLQQNIVAPVEQLQLVAQRIASGDLDTPVALSGQGEFLDLSRSFETMRRELHRSREQMHRWTQDLQDHVARRTQQLSALSEVIATASRSLELDTVLRSALEQSLGVIDSPIGAIWLVAEDTPELRLAVSHNLPPAIQNESRVLAMGEGVTGRAAQTGEIIALEDVSQHAGPIKAVAIREGIRSIVAVPIRSRERVIGVLDVMSRQPRTFSPEELALLTSIGQQIGIAVESLRLMQAVRQQTQQMAAWRERERIGIELHDGILQTISYLYLQTDQFAIQAKRAGWTDLSNKLQTQRDLLGELAREIRRFIADLRELPARTCLLQNALREMLTTLGNDHPIHAQLDDTPIELDEERCEHLVRLAREALLNAVRHSQAHHITLGLARAQHQVTLWVQDDGCGFDPAQLPNEMHEHFGLSIMQARAVRLGGHLKIDSAPGRGTRVELVFTL